MRRNSLWAGSWRRNHGRPNVCMVHPDMVGGCEEAENHARGGKLAQEEEHEAFLGVLKGESKQEAVVC